MKVTVPRHSGFCPGVKNAESRLLAAASGPSPAVAVLGPLIHNRRYLEYLAQAGIRTLESAEEAGGEPLVAIRTHGIERGEEAALREHTQVLDLTCPTVKRIQRRVAEAASRGAFVVIAGKKDHPEVRGVQSYAPERLVVETEADLGALDEARLAPFRTVLVVSQTTGDPGFLAHVHEEVRRRFGAGRSVELLDSLCPATAQREAEAAAVQPSVDVTFVVGDPSSSNATRLYRRLKEASASTWFVQDLPELEALGLPLAQYRSAQVVSSASTPAFIEREIVSYLEKLPEA